VEESGEWHEADQPKDWRKKGQNAKDRSGSCFASVRFRFEERTPANFANWHVVLQSDNGPLETIINVFKPAAIRAPV